MKCKNVSLVKTTLVRLFYGLVLPYLINESLEKSKKQPMELRNIKWYQRNEFSHEEWYRGMVREDALQRTCNNEMRGNYTDNFKCYFLHHFDPYLKMFPFKFCRDWR